MCFLFYFYWLGRIESNQLTHIVRLPIWRDRREREREKRNEKECLLLNIQWEWCLFASRCHLTNFCTNVYSPSTYFQIVACIRRSDRNSFNHHEWVLRVFVCTCALVNIWLFIWTSFLFYFQFKIEKRTVDKIRRANKFDSKSLLIYCGLWKFHSKIYLLMSAIEVVWVHWLAYATVLLANDRKLHGDNENVAQ